MGEPFRVERLGSFTLRRVHSSWSSALMLGALDYYGLDGVDALQIVPEALHATIDVPAMGNAWSPQLEPVWRWLHEAWQYDVPPNSTALTNLDALRGGRVTEVARWEEDEWEMFVGAGPDVSEDEVRVVPLGCLLAADPSLVSAVDLQIGEAMWRDAERGDWHPWRKSES